MKDCNLTGASLIEKLICGAKITDVEIEQELFEICERVHSSCDEECPVYALNGNSPVMNAKAFKTNRGCGCFKDGRAMRQFILSTRVKE